MLLGLLGLPGFAKVFRAKGANLSRLSSLFNKKLPLIFVAILILAAGVGYIGWHRHNNHNQSTPGSAKPNVTKFISLDGGYLFSIPAKYAVDATTTSDTVIVYSKDTPVPGKNLDELYSGGSVTVQPLKQLKNSDAKTFKDYVSNSVAADLRKKMNSGSDVRFSKKGDIEAAEVTAILNSGTILRAAYALNLPQPVIVVAKEESDAFKIVGSSLEDLNRTNLKPDINLAVESAKSLAGMLHRRDASGIKDQGSTDFSKTVNKDQLVANLSASATYLARSITVVGGSYDGQLFIAQLAFGQKTKDEAPVSGALSLSKQGKDWKLDGFQLPQ